MVNELGASSKVLKIDGLTLVINAKSVSLELSEKVDNNFCHCYHVNSITCGPGRTYIVVVVVFAAKALRPRTPYARAHTVGASLPEVSSFNGVGSPSEHPFFSMQAPTLNEEWSRRFDRRPGRTARTQPSVLQWLNPFLHYTQLLRACIVKYLTD